MKHCLEYGHLEDEKQYHPLLRYQKNVFSSFCNTIIIYVYFDYTNWIYFSIIIVQTKAPMLAHSFAAFHTRDGKGGDITVNTMEENYHDIIKNKGIIRLIQDTFFSTNEDAPRDEIYENIHTLLHKCK